jgi:hypothetical protein
MNSTTANTLFRLVSLLTISHVALPVPCHADTQKKTKAPPAPKYATQRAAFASKLPEFDAAWQKAVGESGSPGVFLALATHPQNKKKSEVKFQDNEFPVSFSGFGMDPSEWDPSAWDAYLKDVIKDYFKTHADEKTPVEVFPGARVSLSMSVGFDVPENPPAGDKPVAIFANPRVKPLLPYTWAKTSEGWFRGNNGKPMNVMSFRYTVQVPDDAEPGEMPVTIGGTAKGPGKEFEVDNKYTFKVKKPGPVSRETLMALWANGVRTLQKAKTDKAATPDIIKKIPELLAALRTQLEKITGRPENATHAELVKLMFEDAATQALQQ